MLVTDSCPDSNTWFALWTRSRHEKIVRQQLVEKGIEAFLPTVARANQWRGRRKTIVWPLFPGYCFARFQTAYKFSVLNCVGVVNIVSFNGKPAPIAEEEVNNLRRVVETELPYDPCPLIREGMVVEVTDGPLKGVEGRLLRKTGKHATVVLGVELINQAVRVEIDAGNVRAKEPSSGSRRDAVTAAIRSRESGAGGSAVFGQSVRAAS